MRKRRVPSLRTLAAAAALALVALSAAGQQPPYGPSPLRQPVMVSPAAASAPIPPSPSPPPAQPSSSLIHPILGTSERLEMTVNTSRILTLNQKIPQVQVNNPELLDVTPLSPTQVQVAAKKPGVTQVNLWGENKQIYTLDVTVLGDVRELNMVLRTQFPKTDVKLVPIGAGLIISGYVDRAEQVPLILQIAKEYYPSDKIINSMTVGGVPQVVLHVKVMEVSRTKLRRLGFDFFKNNGASFFTSQVSGLIGAISGGSVSTSGAPTVQFNIANGSSAFFGVLDALRQDGLAKILAEPNLVAISGRPAHFRVGGQYYYQLNGGITGPSASYVDYGTIIDMVPLVLGSGRIRLEVRPVVSEIDQSLTVVGGPPSLKDRMVETGVELKAGQTLAIAGLVQTLVESQNSGLPWISEVPYLGVPFRHVQDQTNEVETLIMVTPELVEPMDANQVPPCGPGMETTSPSDWELFFKGHLEVPVCCNGGGCQGGCNGTMTPAPAGVPGPQPGETLPTPAPSRIDGAAPDPYSRYPNPNPKGANNPNAPAQADAHNAAPPFGGPIGYDPLN